MRGLRGVRVVSGAGGGKWLRGLRGLRGLRVVSVGGRDECCLFIPFTRESCLLSCGGRRRVKNESRVTSELSRVVVVVDFNRVRIDCIRIRVLVYDTASLRALGSGPGLVRVRVRVG